MGRRDVRVTESERWVFNRLAAVYRARPPYPEALVARLAELSGPGGAVADLGAGTGLLAIPLATRGCRVDAVEPAAAMLQVLQQQAFAANVSVRLVHAAAEDTGLSAGGYRLVLFADAAQWVDPQRAAREAARLRAIGGCVAVVEPRPADAPFMSRLLELIEHANPKARPGAKGSGEQLLVAATPGGELVTETFAQDVPLGDEQLGELMQSLSFVGPALGPARMGQLVDDARRLAADCGGAVWSRVLTLRWARGRG